MTVLKSHPLALLRRPLLPQSLLGTVNRALCADPASLEAQMMRVMKNLDFQEAVYLASPELYQLGKNLMQTGRVPGKEKVLLALYKYLIRACTRSTPFGLFAGYTIAGLAQATNISFGGNLKKHGTLSGQVLEQIVAKLAGWDAPSMPDLIGVNTSLYECGASYRYTARTAVSTQNLTGLDFRQIEGNQILRTVIEFCKPSVGLQVITDKLISIGLSSKDSRDLIQTLVQEQILTIGPERPLSLTGYQKQLASKAATHATGEIFSAFEKMQDACIPGADRFAGLTTALAAADIESNAPVQIDLEFGAQRCQISKNAVSGILKQLARLLSDRPSPSSGLLHSFIRRFSNRYEMQLVPLPQALDPDTGIGYGHLISPSPQNEQVMNLLRQDQPASNASLFPAAWMQRAYFQATARRGAVYMLTEQDLPGAVCGNIEGFSILGSIIAKSQGCLDKGEYLFELKGISGPGSAGLIARFADSNPELCQAASQMVESEQTDYAAVVFAEIAYAANGAAGHVTRRPPLNKYQICFLTGTENEMIPLEDIMVGVRDGKAILFSKSLGKRVLPRLNSAHNFASGPPIYRFLCDLASQDAPTLFWDGALPAHYPFFPRVQYGRIVVSKAQWHIGKSLLADIPESPDSHKAWWSKVRRSLGIPRMVYAGQHDRQLIIDGSCQVAIRLVIEMLQSQQVVRLTEVLRAPGPGLLTYKGKSYCNEIVIPVRSAGHVRTYQDLQRSEFAKNNVVTCHQGWLFLKLYGSENSLQHLLVSKLLTLIESLLKQGRIHKWFFIRYKDPEPHLRIRLYSPAMPKQAASIAGRFYKLIRPDLASGLVSRVQTQGYEREISRYRLLSYESMETLFFIDSQAVGQLLREQNVSISQHAQWLTAMVAVDHMFSACGYSLEGKFQLCQLASRKSASTGIDQLYRKHKSDIFSAMSGATSLLLPSRVLEILHERKAAISQVMAEQMPSDNKATQALMTDLMHLFCNRYFISHQQLHEQITYHFLKKYYDYQLNVEKVCITRFASHQM